MIIAFGICGAGKKGCRFGAYILHWLAALCARSLVRRDRFEKVNLGYAGCLPATFLVLFALPGIIVFSALVGFIGLFALPLAQVVGWVDWLFLKYMLVIVGGFAALPYSSLELGSMDAAWVWLYYGVLGGAVLAFSRKGAF